MSSDQQITNLLIKWSQGDVDALEQLMPVVYDQLKRLAAGQLRHERSDHTLEPVALVNEAYLRLVELDRVRWNDRVHFFAIAAQHMRRILIDHARRHGYRKRGGGIPLLPLDELRDKPGDEPTDVVALEEALRELEHRSPDQAKIVELRYFGGLNRDEIAEVLHLSSATVTRRWRLARAWLYQYLVEGERLEL